MKLIPYNKQYLSNSDISAVKNVLNQKLITNGPSVIKFETKLKSFLNVKYCTTCINGTAGLHLAFEALNLRENDVVIMPIINFISSFSMAKLYNLKIYFADVEKRTGQMSPQTLTQCIKKNKIKNIKAIVNMYMGGFPENVVNFYKLKKKYGFYIIEDACHAFGAAYKYKNKFIKIGSCKHSDICVFSYHPVKTITTGEGGSVSTNNSKFYKRMINFKSHNIVRKNKYWDYDITKLAFNYRLSDLNCALGISQIKKINFFLKKRKKLFDEYNNLLSKNSNYIQMIEYDRKTRPSFHLGLVNLKLKKKKKESFIKYLNKKNIYPQYHYKPLNLFKCNKKLKLKLNKFEGANYYFKNFISLPLYVDLKKTEIKKICHTILNFYNS